MIEKFTPQELETIRKELLALYGSPKVQKSVQFSEEEQRIRSMFQNEEHAIVARKERTVSTTACADAVWESLITICDHTLKNYASHKTPYGIGFSRNKWLEVDADTYKHLLNEFIRLIEEEMR